MNPERERKEMNDVIGIIKRVEGLLDEMYELGREEGYEEAKREFRAPDF